MAAELGKIGIPAHAISRTGYFSTQEIQVLLNYLAILDNPRQDIPLASVLTSWFGGLGEEELGYLRAVDKEKPFYENVLAWMPESKRSRKASARNCVRNCQGDTGKISTFSSDISETTKKEPLSANP